MPDTFSVSLVIVSLWFFSEYMEKGNYWSLFIGSVLLSLGVLSKIPALVPVASLLFFLLGNYPIQKKVLLCFAVILSLMPVYWWYFKWVPHLISLNQKPLFFPRSLREGFFEIMEYKSAVIEQFTFHTFFAFSGFILAVGGVVLLIKKHLKIELLVLVALSFTMILFIFKTGNVFPRHSYYMVPFAPVMAVLLGYLLHNIPHKWAIGLLAVFIIESVANQHHDFLRRPTREYLLNLEEMANGFSDRNMKIVCNGGENPQLIYFINRRGWSVETSTITNKSLKNWMDKDAQFLFIDKTKGVVEETILFPKIISTKEVDVYRLK